MSKHSSLTMQKVWDLKILDVADKLQIKYSSRGAFRKCHCFMHDDKTPSMWFKLRNNTWSCPVCQKGGGIVSLVEEHENLKFDEAVDWLIREFNINCYDDNEPYRPLKSSTRKSKPKMTCTTQTSAPIAEPINPKPSTINQGLLAECFSTESSFCKALVSNNILTPEQMQHAAERYHLGVTRDGGVIFWQIDEQQRIREGKIMFYQPNCHRNHQHAPSSVSSRLIKQSKLSKGWTATHCLFGLHLLTQRLEFSDERLSSASIYDKPNTINDEAPKNNKQSTINGEAKVAIVESEKTAIICSELIPTLVDPSARACSLSQSEATERTINPKPSTVVWLATGGSSFLTTTALQPLAQLKAKIIIFPDTDSDGTMFNKWKTITEKASKALNIPIYISDILEKNATPDQKSRKIDIADFLIENR